MLFNDIKSMGSNSATAGEMPANHPAIPSQGDRIKNTVERIKDGKKYFVLIDELFKGTNIQDAMKCSTTVIEGLQKSKTCLFILSSHLYEISSSLTKFDNIQFKYFETTVTIANSEQVPSLQVPFVPH